MQLQQQEEDLQINDIQDEEGEEDILITKGNNQSKGISTIKACILAFLSVFIFVTFRIATSLQQRPKIYLDYYEQAYSPQNITQQAQINISAKKKFIFQQKIREINIQNQYSAYELVQVEKTNSAHRNYQRTMRQIEYKNAQMLLNSYKDLPFSQQSTMTFRKYLSALQYLKLSTYPINDFSTELNKLSNEQRTYYTDKYLLNTLVHQNSMCVVMTLTQQGIQSGNYYLALRSIFQQQYNNFKLIIINHPFINISDELKKLITVLGPNKIVLIDRINNNIQKIHTSFFIQGVFHKYCVKANMTILMRDNGELIGKQVFRVMNKIYHQQKPPIIFTHYLLTPANPFISGAQTFRFKVQLYPRNLETSRVQFYKTKYLKVYDTKMLLQVSEEAYKNSKGDWLQGLFEANLQFSLLQLSCGRYFLLDQIMYIASKNDIQNSLQVTDARRHKKQNCYIEKKVQQKVDQKQPNSYRDKPIQYNTIENVANLTKEQISKLKNKFILIQSNRAKYNVKVSIPQTRQINQTYISKIDDNSNISLNKLKNLTQKFLFGARLSLYNDILNQNNSYKKVIFENKQKPQIQKFKFVVFLITYNNAIDLSVLYTIESVILQADSHIRLIIIDNKSNDLTASIIKYHLSIIPQKKQSIFFYQTPSKLRKSQIVYQAIRQFAKQDQIIIILQSGEELFGQNVLMELNREYTRTNALAIYGNGIYIENQQIKVASANLQKYTSLQPLRTFKVQVFKMIKDIDFKKEKIYWIDNENQMIATAVSKIACKNLIYLNQILIRLPQQPIQTLNSKAMMKYQCLQVKQNQLKNQP